MLSRRRSPDAEDCWHIWYGDERSIIRSRGFSTRLAKTIIGARRKLKRDEWRVPWQAWPGPWEGALEPKAVPARRSRWPITNTKFWRLFPPGTNLPRVTWATWRLQSSTTFGRLRWI